MAKVGLIRGRESALLGDFLASYIADRTDVKPLTEKKYRTTESLLSEHLAGKASRTLPLFPELRPHLDAAYEWA